MEALFAQDDATVRAIAGQFKKAMNSLRLKVVAMARTLIFL
jgi:hypothetical protein